MGTYGPRRRSSNVMGDAIAPSVVRRAMNPRWDGGTICVATGATSRQPGHGYGTETTGGVRRVETDAEREKAPVTGAFFMSPPDLLLEGVVDVGVQEIRVSLAVSNIDAHGTGWVEPTTAVTTCPQGVVIGAPAINGLMIALCGHFPPIITTMHGGQLQ